MPFRQIYKRGTRFLSRVNQNVIFQYSMLKIKIIDWDKSQSWAKWPDYKRQFINRVQEHTNMTNTDIKRLAKIVFSEGPSEIKLNKISKANEASGICHILESMGAILEISET